ncbi:MAG: DinB family protein [Saprospiraceae bacterium]|nr:DinB family protein [Saprospiraceae bacterium]
MTRTELKAKEFDVYYGRYINKVDVSRHLREGFSLGKKEVEEYFAAIPASLHNYAYAENKWTIKEVLQHLIDTERIFSYRCFRIARRDQSPLAGFDQNIYIGPSLAQQKTMLQLLREFAAGRNHTISLLESLSNDDLAQIGIASGNPMSARAAAFTIIGHDSWHMEIIKDRYLNHA